VPELVADPAVELATSQLEAAQNSETEARTRYEGVQERITGLGEEPDADEVRTLSTELEEAGQAFEDAHSEAERCEGNLAAARRRADIPEADRRRRPDPVARGSQRTELAYRPDDRRTSFFRDAFRLEYLHDSQAGERLARNSAEQFEIVREAYPDAEFRDVGTGAFAGLVVPQYLIDLYAPLARAGSPFINAVRKQALPDDGMTLNISRLTTGSATAAQATENTAVQETDMDDTLLTINVRTYAGMQDVSRQLLERGSLGDDLIYADLVSAYFTTLDSAAINADGTSGTHLGVRSTVGIVAVTYTDATPTVAELYPKLADAIQQINSGRFEPATTIVMHPRRWGWLTAAVDSSGRPFVIPNSNGPFNAIAVGEAAEYGQVVGTMHGLPVITDANIPTNLGTNEDVILVVRMPDDLLWWEGDGMPRQFRFEQVAPPQTIRLAVWGYTGFTAGRYPLANATIAGTGLIAPTF